MSHIPRRTSEFQHASERKSTSQRPSRLAQPSTSSSSVMRNIFARASATPSMARMTPSKTPSRDRNTNFVPLTAEKEKPPVDDKVFIQGKTHQVMEELSKVDGFGDLLQKGLKSMTHKQFINILQLFLKPLVGPVKLDGSNYIDYIYNLLPTFEYPYAGLTKSSLKTPTAPHCYNSIVLLLAWLTEQRDPESTICLTVSDELDSLELSAMFMQKSAQSFELWNKENEAEADEVQEQIRLAYIEKKTGIKGSLEGEVTRLKRTIEEMKLKEKPASLQKQTSEKEEEVRRVSQGIDQLEREVSDVSKEIRSARKNLEAKNANLRLLIEEHQAEMKKLSKQKMTLEQKNEKLMELTQLKSKLAEKRSVTNSLNETKSIKEIELSNLIQKKFRLVERLNNFIYTVSSDLIAAGLKGDFDPSRYEIKKTKISDASDLDQELNRLHQGLMELCVKHQRSMEDVEHSLMQLNAKKNKLESETEQLTVKVEHLRTSLDEAQAEEAQLQQEMKVARETSYETCRKLSTEIKSMTEEIEEVKRNIQQYEQRNLEIIEEKSKFKKNSLVTIKKLHEERKAEVEKKREEVNRYKKIFEEFDKIKKPLTQEVLDHVKNFQEEVRRAEDSEDKEN